MLQDYNDNALINWTPSKSGKYELVVHAKDINNSSQYDNYAFKQVNVLFEGIGGKTIVIDAGHGGTDPGAVSRHDGVVFKEAELNLQLAIKLREELQRLGANVIMTRSTNDKALSLEERSNIANNSNAYLFISLHHDSNVQKDANGNYVKDADGYWVPDPSVSGISTHYSTYRPNIDTSGVIEGEDPNGWYTNVDIDTTPSEPAIMSAILADKIVNGLSSLGYNNRNDHDHNLSVTKNTNMVSILIELGFVTNPGEVKKCADSDQQLLKAQKLAQIINEFYL